MVFKTPMKVHSLADEGQRSWRDRKQARWALWLLQHLPWESLQPMAQGLENPEEFAHPELRRWSWASGEAKVPGIHRTEYQRGEGHTQRIPPQIFSRGTLSACEGNGQSREKKLVQLGRIKLDPNRGGYNETEKPHSSRATWVGAQESLVSWYKAYYEPWTKYDLVFPIKS